MLNLCMYVICIQMYRHTHISMSHTKITEYLTNFTPQQWQFLMVQPYDLKAFPGALPAWIHHTNLQFSSKTQLIKQPHKCSLMYSLHISISVNSHLHILHLITRTYIKTQNDKLIHKCPHTPHTRYTHTKLTDVHDGNLHMLSHTHSSEPTRWCTHRLPQIYLPISRYIQNHSQT